MLLPRLSPGTKTVSGHVSVIFGLELWLYLTIRFEWFLGNFNSRWRSVSVWRIAMIEDTKGRASSIQIATVDKQSGQIGALLKPEDRSYVRLIWNKFSEFGFTISPAVAVLPSLLIDAYRIELVKVQKSSTSTTFICRHHHVSLPPQQLPLSYPAMYRVLP